MVASLALEEVFQGLEASLCKLLNSDRNGLQVSRVAGRAYHDIKFSCRDAHRVGVGIPPLKACTW